MTAAEERQAEAINLLRIAARDVEGLREKMEYLSKRIGGREGAMAEFTLEQVLGGVSLMLTAMAGDLAGAS